MKTLTEKGKKSVLEWYSGVSRYDLVNEEALFEEVESAVQNGLTYELSSTGTKSGNPELFFDEDDDFEEAGQ